MSEGQAQLVRNGILLLAILAPAAAGLWAISTPLVERLVAAPFREMTAAVLPWAIVAGAARNMRIHFGEQVFLLREETHVPLVNDIIDGLTTILGGAVGFVYGGLPGSVQGAAIGRGSEPRGDAGVRRVLAPVSRFRYRISCAS